MSGFFSTGRRKTIVVAMAFAITVVGIWALQKPAQRWYSIHRLAQANESQLPAWVERVADLDAAAMSGLIDLLRRSDVKACANSQATLAVLVSRWGPADVRTAKLAKNLTSSFSSLSTPGRKAILDWCLGLRRDPEVKAGPMADLGLDLAKQGLASKNAEVCLASIAFLLHEHGQPEKEILDGVLPCLKHSSPEVRRAAILAVGLAEETVPVDALLPLLQDSDSEVRRLCEAALRGRGLQDSHIKLAKLITDERPAQRLQVLRYLSEAEDLDPGIWLMRLSQDPSPAVRAAAVRFAAEDGSVFDFQQRVAQMTQQDPSPTVRQVATFYLKNYARRN
jgi:HEAT repeat protein